MSLRAMKIALCSELHRWKKNNAMKHHVFYGIKLSDYVMFI